MACLPRALAVLALILVLSAQQADASMPLSLLSIRLSDLRPGYLVADSRSFTRSTIAKREPVAAPLLLSHGWTAGYEALYRRQENHNIQVGEAVDQFENDQGAHWWFGASLLRVPSIYHSIHLAAVGNESAAVQSREYVGIIFRRGVYVADVYVSLQAPSPPYSALALARLEDRRLGQEVQPLASYAVQRKQPAPARTSHRVFRQARTMALRAWVRPNSMLDDASPSLYARTTPGAICTAQVRYAAGRPSQAFNGYPERAGGSGMVHWRWHEEMPVGSGIGTVTCTLAAQTKSAQASFKVTA